MKASFFYKNCPMTVSLYISFCAQGGTTREPLFVKAQLQCNCKARADKEGSKGSFPYISHFHFTLLRGGGKKLKGAK
jgi:hypothetical protein